MLIFNLTVPKNEVKVASTLLVIYNNMFLRVRLLLSQQKILLPDPLLIVFKSRDPDTDPELFFATRKCLPDHSFHPNSRLKALKKMD